MIWFMWTYILSVYFFLAFFLVPNGSDIMKYYLNIQNIYGGLGIDFKLNGKNKCDNFCK